MMNYHAINRYLVNHLDMYLKEQVKIYGLDVLKHLKNHSVEHFHLIRIYQMMKMKNIMQQKHGNFLYLIKQV